MLEQTYVGKGVIVHVKGPVVIAEGMRGSKIREVVYVGEERLIGEIVRIEEDRAVIQVYEPTGGVKAGEPVERTGEPLSAELGPGLLGQVLDGLGRPLDIIAEKAGGPFIVRGIKSPTLPRDRKWHWIPQVKRGDLIQSGDVLGKVKEGPIDHKIMLPPNIMRARVLETYPEGDYTIEEGIVLIEHIGGKEELKMYQKWPVRNPRPFKEKLDPSELLITGQRVIDTFFPIVKGGTSAVPGGFGTGKTVTLHQISKWADADVVVYVGCGERGNEMTDLLHTFPKLVDPKTGRPLLERSVLIANTSNMPVPAREASIFMGVTYAEYYRDMGLHVVLTADSTSRWAEALRELSSRLEEIPSEKGFPAYLPDFIASFYERAGRVKVIGNRDEIGSIAIIGAVSPSGGDLNEPVTQHTMRYVGAFWALDKDLAFKRHFPSINWLRSFSKYAPALKNWWINATGHDMVEYRDRAMSLLQAASSLEEVARVVGEAALSDENRLVLLSAELIKEGFLVQSAYHEVDTYCSPKKQAILLRTLLEFYERAKPLIEAGVPMSKIAEMRSLGLLRRLKFVPEKEFEAAVRDAISQLEAEISSLLAEVR
ncbi:V-type ATP synthase subunit A [Candidatus Korarchaeum cryptofilum]|jgi:V/A-type H+-transporting ATPase subunit A|uniref:A-type ATP synthase subunit A n=1 Tax=Candidatus Korarchaeum cryptofilum TaxID=498846 RepID=A0A429G764_9CREN|nr:V-type ATP synthase subunit A [Candidatus Korarchaeum cryptofilum]RSN69689.1 V-type ATP synthase subunit A [Candidatus Korarchaeum cryptofilum]